MRLVLLGASLHELQSFFPVPYLGYLLPYALMLLVFLFGCILDLIFAFLRKIVLFLYIGRFLRVFGFLLDILLLDSGPVPAVNIL